MEKKAKMGMRLQMQFKLLYTKSHPIRTELCSISLCMSRVTRKGGRQILSVLQIVLHSEVRYVPILVPPDPCLAVQALQFYATSLKTTKLVCVNDLCLCLWAV